MSIYCWLWQTIYTQAPIRPSTFFQYRHVQVDAVHFLTILSFFCKVVKMLLQSERKTCKKKHIRGFLFEGERKKWRNQVKLFIAHMAGWLAGLLADFTLIKYALIKRMCVSVCTYLYSINVSDNFSMTLVHSSYWGRISEHCGFLGKITTFSSEETWRNLNNNKVIKMR